MWLITAAFISLIIYSNIVPLKFLLILIGGVIAWIGLISLFLLKFRKKKKVKIAGYILFGITFVLMAGVFYYISVTLGFLSGFGSNRYKEEHFLVMVLKDSDYQEITDLENEKIWYVDSEINSINKALEELGNRITFEASLSEDYLSLFEKLVNEEIEALIIEESIKHTVYEKSDEVDYEELVRELYRITIRTRIDDFGKEVDVESAPFAIYISGIDTTGSISNVARSDSNIVAIVNPSTKQILLVSIPRDFYVQIHGTTGLKDKLTHVGIYGIERSVRTVEDLLDIDIHFYLRVNFTSLIKMVDILGGIDVYSEHAFTTRLHPRYRIARGFNHLNGEQALAFSRERFNVPGGDRGRGKNQQAVIDGIIRKATSSAIITRYSSILNALSGNFQTNITERDMTRLIRMQINDMARWTITNHSLDGSDGSDFTFTHPRQRAYVMIPNVDTIKEAQSLIERVRNGEKLEGSFNNPVTNVNTPTVVPRPPVVPQFTINFNSNGGSRVNSIRVRQNQRATRPTNPTREGFVFDCWVLNGSCFNFNTPITRNITLRASWESDNRVPVTFLNEDGSRITTVRVSIGQLLIPPADPTPPTAGHKFDVWRLSDTTPFDFSVPVTISNPFDLYASFVPDI